MKRPEIYTVLLLLLTLQGVGQDFNNYQPITCQAPVPEDFLLTSSEKYLDKVISAEHEHSEQHKAAKDRFFVHSSFSINQLLYSGQVLFNDPLSNYISEVADVLLKDKPELRKQLRFYAVKSPEVNAFATNSGIVLVNIGLLAHVDNEAELAFILSHEIQHYVEQHVLKQFVKKELGTSTKSETLLLDESFFSSKQYSRDLELEADSLGVQLFLASGYNYIGVDEAMDMLLYSDLPFANTKFDFSVLEAQGIKIPEKYDFEDVEPIEERAENYVDRFSSHPNIRKRRDQIERIIADTSAAEAPFFQVSAEKFYNIQKRARFELPRLHYKAADYERAIYLSFLMLEEEPESQYLQGLIGNSLYALSKYANDDNHYDDVHVSYRGIDGEQKRVNYLMHRLKDWELNVLAYCYVDSFLNNMFESATTEQIRTDLIHELLVNHTREMREIFEQVSINRGEKPLEAEEKERKASTFKTALIEQLSRNDVVYEEFKAMRSQVEAEEEIARETPRKRKLKADKYQLGIDKMMVVDPFYYAIDEREKDQVRYFDAEGKKESFEQLLVANADGLDLETKLFSVNELSAGDVTAFNDMVVLKEFFSEYYLHNGRDLLTYDYEALDELKAKYGMHHLSWMGATTIRGKKGRRDLAKFGLSVVIFPLIPYGIYKLVKPKYQTSIYTTVFDLDQRKTAMVYTDNFQRNDSPKFMNAKIKGLLQQMTKE